MRAGRLRHRLQLQSLTEAADAFGQEIRSYSTYATVWGEVKPLREKEIEAAKQIFSEAEVKITIRYNSDVSETDRIVFDGKTYEIGGVIDPYERNRDIELMCKVIE